jgi:hypothetical protein
MKAFLGAFLFVLALCGGAVAAPTGSSYPAIPFSYLGAVSGAAPLDANGMVPASETYPRGSFAPCGGNWGLADAGQLPSLEGETNILNYTCSGPVSAVKLKIPAAYIVSGNEVPMPNIVFHHISVVYGGLTTPRYLTVNGNEWIAVPPNSSDIWTDPLPLYGEPTSSIQIRYGTFVATAPTVTGATASGGTLAVGAHYYKVTCLVPTNLVYPQNYAESGPSNEVSATTTSGTQSVTLSITPNAYSPLGCSAADVYSATSSGNEVYLARVTDPNAAGSSASFTYSDTGAVSNGTAAPPAVNRYQLIETMHAGDHSNSPSFGDAGTDITGTTSNSGTYGGPTDAYSQNAIAAPEAVYGATVAAANPAICGLGDSRMEGRGVMGGSSVNNLGPNLGNWFNQTFPAGTYDTVNTGISGSYLGSVTGAATSSAADRMGMFVGCKYVINELGINDIDTGTSGSQPWQVVAAWDLQLAQAFYKSGVRFVQTVPYMAGTSTDNGIGGYTNFTPYATEPQRELLASWMRNGGLAVTCTANGVISGTTLTISGSSCAAWAVGSPVSLTGGSGDTYITALGTGTGGNGTYTVNNSQTVSGTISELVPVQSGGAATPYIYAFYDQAAALGEVNAAGVPTLNGGYWPAAQLVGSGTAGGTPTTTSIPISAITISGLTVAAHNLSGYDIKFTSGAANGQSCMISDNPNVSTMTCNGGNTNLTVAPASGDAFNVYAPQTFDGLHATIFGDTNMVNGSTVFGYPNFSTWAAAHLVAD